MPIPKDILINSILPPNLKPSPIPPPYAQYISNDSHIIYFELGKPHCYMRYFPFIYRDFSEMKMEIPYVQFAQDMQNGEKEASEIFMYKPMVYEDSFFDTMASWFVFGLNARYANMNVNYGDDGKSGIYEIEYKNTKFIAIFDHANSAWKPVDEFPYFQVYMDMNKDRWLASNYFTGSVKCSSMGYFYNRTLLKPANVNITIHAEILPGFNKFF